MTNQYAQRARSLRGLIESEAAKPENAMTMSPVVGDALREQGLFWLLVPESLGGSDVSTVTFIEMVEELASSDAATSWSLMANSVATMVAATYSSDAHVKRMFGGDRLPIMTSTYAPTGKTTFADGFYRCSGTHSWGTGIGHADWVSGANVVFENGEPVVQANGKPKVVGAFLHKDQIRLAGNWDVVGLQATGSFDYEVPEQDIPADWTFNQYWTEPQRPSKSANLGTMVVVCAGHTAVVLGIARRALHEAAVTASKKKRLHSADCIASTPVFQNDFLQHEALFQAARALTLDVFAEADRLAETGEALSELQIQRVRQVTTWTHQVCKDIVNYAFGSVSSALRNPSMLGKCLSDVAVAAHHIVAGPMSLIDAAPQIIDSWAIDRMPWPGEQSVACPEKIRIEEFTK
ncbi:acyl-CoA dehydrogenase family protein [Novosphingobium sp. PASSN1]|uniref:acyl-CoA dehydrogenase family protein n=1 Tax=Novosphingobium sp. PASSN1 TaxID=2015561 RepID=UPI0025FA7AAF|nr:acyl-CoA dehydrogenase family protein [Novosphingobium sp. PASSN1]